MHVLTTSSDDDRSSLGRVGEGRRYILRERLGQGSFGTVFCADDSRYGARVAIKFLHRADPDALYRFKLEFRSLAELSHPNLVRLYELAFEHDRWFVVMEHVDGVDLKEHLRGRHADAVPATLTDGPSSSTGKTNAEPVSTTAVDLTRLRTSFAQLTQGLMALHAARKLHRDIKPSNVLVTRDGRVVILDFGLVIELGEELGSLSGPSVGTPGYMPPEQAQGRQLSPASDWYAFGALLHEALLGAPPRGEESRAFLRRPVLGVPDELRTLVHDLLDPDPARRPGASTILEALGFGARDDDELRAQVYPASNRLIGRGAHLDALDAAMGASRSGPVLVRITGVSGVGKTSLARAWLRRFDGSSSWVLRGRCLEHEDLPFKAMDGIVDALAARLLAAPLEQRAKLLPVSIDASFRMFPVLAGVVQPGTFSDAPDQVEAHTLRERAFASVRALFHQVAAEHSLVICIDDVQWGDADGARLLAELLRPPARNILVVILQRPTERTGAFAVALEERLARDSSVLVRELQLGELDTDDACSLAASCLGEHDVPVEITRRIAHEAGGNPFFIRQLAEALSESDPGSGRGGAVDVRFSDLLSQKLARLPRAERTLVEVTALAARPLAEDVVLRAAEAEGLDVRAALLAAERAHFVSGIQIEGRRFLEAPHDRLREEIVRLTPPSDAIAHHARIARALIAAGPHEPETLLPHYLGANDFERASDVALDAAQRAESALAFEQAAENYALVLRLGRREALRASLLERRGGALANAGRAASAAEVLEEASAVLARTTASSPSTARAVRNVNRRSAELWLRSGYVDRGMARFQDVLGELGVPVPASEKAALRTAIWLRLKLVARGLHFQGRAEGDIDNDVLERLDALWGVTTSLGMLKPMSSDVFQLRHLLEALTVGEPTRVLRGLVHEVTFASVLGGPLFDRRARALIATMEKLAEEMDLPYLRAWVLHGRGMAAWFKSDWLGAWNHCDEAARVYARECRGAAWELAVCDVYRCSALTYLGRVAALAEIVPDVLRTGRERGDRYATANMAFYESFLLLTRDRPEDAIAIVKDAIRPFPRGDFLAIHYGIAYAIAQGHLYRDAPESAWEHIEREWPAWRSAGMTSVQCVRTEMRYLRARAAVALLASSRRGSSALSSKAARAAMSTLLQDVKHLESDRAGAAHPLALAIRAGMANIERKSTEAVDLLDRAATAFEQNGMALHAASARFHLSRLSTLSQNRERATEVMRRFEEEGVVRPEGMFDLVITGFRQ